MTDLNIKLLLERISKGDQFAFTKLFNHLSPGIYGNALRITGKKETAEEVVQDTFLKVWLKKDELQSIQNFEAWLYVVARNYTFKALQGAKRNIQITDELSEEIYIPFESDTDRKIMESQYNRILKDAIERLPEKQKKTYVLIKEQALKRNEVAEKLNVSSETVKDNLKQAMKSIRAYCMANINDMPKVLFLIYLSKNL